MEPYLPISFLNDFTFCPRSVYFHNLYKDVSTSLYHTQAQRRGLEAHKKIDTASYTTAKTMLQAFAIYSEKYRLCGKIDRYDMHTQTLIEQKEKITAVYSGFIFQLYAQYFCLEEMGYPVKSMRLYSKRDNKVYPVKKPQDAPQDLQAFEQCVQDVRKFDLNRPFTPNPKKCCGCIYSSLCDMALC